jgi:hypothetical protein
MNVDRYTKAVLTVIAGCLLWMCVMTAAPAVSAQPSAWQIPNASVQPVVIVGTGTLDTRGTVTVNFVRDNGAQRTDPTLPVQLPYTAARPLPVGLPYSALNPLPAKLTNTSDAPIPVEINGVRKVGEWEPLRARVEDAPARTRPGGGL